MSCAKIKFLKDGFGNGIGDVVKVIDETLEEVYYYDEFHRLCYLYKKDEGIDYKYIPKYERVNKKKEI